MKTDHAWYENISTLILATSIVTLGILMLNKAGLLIGGTAGLAILLTKVTSLTFGLMYFVLNVPFYWLAYKKMGAKFTINTLIAVTMVSFMAEFMYIVIDISFIQPIYSALIGGSLIGVGMLMLFRHKFSLGGVGILALYVQQRFNIRAGNVQMAIDCLIVVCSLFIVSFELIAYSVLAAIALNAVLVINHRPGRYQPNSILP